MILQVLYNSRSYTADASDREGDSVNALTRIHTHTHRTTWTLALSFLPPPSRMDTIVRRTWYTPWLREPIPMNEDISAKATTRRVS